MIFLSLPPPDRHFSACPSSNWRVSMLSGTSLGHASNDTVVILMYALSLAGSDQWLPTSCHNVIDLAASSESYNNRRHDDPVLPLGPALKIARFTRRFFIWPPLVSSIWLISPLLFFLFITPRDSWRNSCPALEYYSNFRLSIQTVFFNSLWRLWSRIYWSCIIFWGIVIRLFKFTKSFINSNAFVIAYRSNLLLRVFLSYIIVVFWLFSLFLE